MTRAEAIERAWNDCEVHGSLEILYDAALIAGLQRAVKIVQKAIKERKKAEDAMGATSTIGSDLMSRGLDAIRAEIALRKGAKAK